jgi:hypothetical protein
MEKVEFKGWKNCVEMQSGDFRIIITTEIGPRVIGGFLGSSPNLFYVDESTAGDSGGDEWKIYGGHRLWTSPEEKPRTYEPDNSQVKVTETDEGISFSSGTDPKTGIFKDMIIKPLGDNKFKVTHILRNDNVWDVELAAWALSVMAPGGMSVVPQPQGDKTALLPNRYFTIWPYTNMGDARLTFGDKFIFMKQDSQAEYPCKYGLNGEDGWMAYVNNGVAFVKSYEHLIDAEYPDNGCSIELFTNDFMHEIETLSPLYQLGPEEEIIHVEEWKAVDDIGQISSEADAAKYFPVD